MSDIQATTQPGAAAPTEGLATEAQFQSFFDAAPEPERREDGAQAADSQRDAPQTQETGADADAVQQMDAPQYQSLAELLTAHKIDPESVMGLHVATKIDGVEKQVPLADVLKSYQLEGHVNNKSIEVSNLKAAVEQERAQFQQAAQIASRQYEQMAAVAMQMLNHDFSKIDWNTLRIQNPAEFAALNAEFQGRQQQIQGFLSQIQQQQQQINAQQQAALKQALVGEQEKMLSAIPEWRNKEAFTKDREQIAQYARNLGFQDAELSQINDHRYIRVLHDAARYRALQAASPQVLKQVREAPAAAKPGSRQDVNPKDAQRRQAIERFNRNPGDVDAQAAAFDYFANQ